MLLRLGSFVCFLLAAFAAFGWVFDWTLGTVFGLIASGLALWVASTLDYSTIPVSRG